MKQNLFINQYYFMYSDEYCPNRIYLSSFPVVGYCRTTRSQYNIRKKYKIHH